MTNNEMLEEWDWDTAQPTGRAIERKNSHLNGIPHEGVHLWIIKTDNAVPEILFQQRAKNKELYPGCLDITVGGHVPFGKYKNKIQKEAYEEIGIKIPDKDLIDLGYFRYEEKNRFHFHREFQRVYFTEDNRPLNKYRFVDGEVVGIYTVPIINLEGLFKDDFSFIVKGYNGNKIVKRAVKRRDFHPLLFAESMDEYMKVLFKGIKEYIAGQEVKVRMPLF